jgi:hypothetical protein
MIWYWDDIIVDLTLSQSIQGLRVCIECLREIEVLEREREKVVNLKRRLETATSTTTTTRPYTKGSTNHQTRLPAAQQRIL